jgi:tetratricopeptide (TPR) repeat protein
MPGRAEEALAFFRQAADKYERLGDTAMEGVVRINLGSALLHLRRLDEARQEILRAIECNSRFEDAPERWSVWAVLASIEANAGNTTASAEAKQKAVADYLAYRREGGENHFVDGRICLDVTRALLAGDSAAATALLTQLADDPKASWLLTFIKALQAIAAGSRDRTLADNPELDFTMAAEVLFLIETLEKAGN